MTIMELAGDGFHNLQSQSGRTECWEEGWIPVPPALEQEVWATGGYFEPVLESGALVGIVPTPRPQPEEAVSEMEQLRADVDYIAVMTGVSL